MRLKNSTHRSRGFTLIEILIVIGIIAILAGIVLVAINPSRQFKQANNAQRESNIAAILNAVGQYTIDNKGTFPEEIQDDEDEISGTTGVEDADLCDVLVPKYLPALPVDPLEKQSDTDLSETDQSITEDECDENYKTGYTVQIENGRIVVSAPQTEDLGPDADDAVEIISVTR
jgi:type IV pilus assembly protein PilA